MLRISKITVLIVEDNPGDVKFISDSLQENGILAKNIKATNHSDEALAMIEVEEPTIVFVDLILACYGGTGDGMLLLKSIHEIYENEPTYRPFTIAISSYIRKEVASYCDAYFRKYDSAYPIRAFQRYLMQGGHQTSFLEKSRDFAENTDYMKDLTSLIEAELEPYNFFALNSHQQLHVAELIRQLISEVDKPVFTLKSVYRKIVKVFQRLMFIPLRQMLCVLSRMLSLQLKIFQNCIRLMTANLFLSQRHFSSTLQPSSKVK